MQILFGQGTEHSEHGAHAGVGIWDGIVSKLDAPILPHMGWNTVEANSGSVLFKGIETESFYFVHSFAAKSAVGKTQAWTTHGEKFLAAVEDGYISATQFHPEKSGAAGLGLIKNWVGSL
jgi:glutamine amidotransferase